jgi:hypothetical protein
MTLLEPGSFRCPQWVDVVEKVAGSVGIVLLGCFDPAELSRLLGFVSAGLTATSTRTRLA